MKKLLLLILITTFAMGCQTTFEQRKKVYVAVYKEAKQIIREIGPTAANIYLDKKVADGDITEEEKQQFLAIAEATLKKHDTK